MLYIEHLLLDIQFFRGSGEPFDYPTIETLTKCFQELERFKELEKECELLKNRMKKR